MLFSHSPQLLDQFPQLSVATLSVTGVTAALDAADETYATFAGDTETPEAAEVIFADDAGHAHARRWTNRQSGRSGVRPETHVVLIVSEAMHDTGQHDVNALREELREALRCVGP